MIRLAEINPSDHSAVFDIIEEKAKAASNDSIAIIRFTEQFGKVVFDKPLEERDFSCLENNQYKIEDKDVHYIQGKNVKTGDTVFSVFYDHHSVVNPYMGPNYEVYDRSDVEKLPANQGGITHLVCFVELICMGGSIESLEDNADLD